jgi:hypothetical protein
MMKKMRMKAPNTVPRMIKMFLTVFVIWGELVSVAGLAAMLLETFVVGDAVRFVASGEDSDDVVIVALEAVLLLDIFAEDEVGDGESSELSNDIPKSSSVSRLVLDVVVGAIVNPVPDCAWHIPSSAQTRIARPVTRS